MSKSVDLREAAVKYKLKGHSLRKTAKVFGVSKSAVDKWVKKYEETGDLSNKPLNRPFKKIDPEKLKEHIKEHSDDTQKEIAKKFGCCTQSVSKAMKRLGITRKKRQNIIKNKTLKK